MDVKTYLQRIQYDGPLDNTAEVLKQLCDCHTRNVPFEVLDMFGGKRKVLDLANIYNDVVVNRRGGFCYENNGLFHWLLTQLGFEAKIMQAQAYVKSQKTFNPEFDHMTLQVTCADGSKWLVDVGWGGSSFVLPLKFEELTEQPQRNGMYRLRKEAQDGMTYYVEKVKKQVIKGREKEKPNKDRNTWDIVYKFHVMEHKMKDFEEMCNYQQDSEKSFLKYNSIACIQSEEGLVLTWGLAICKRKYIDPYTEEITSVKVANSVEELKEVLKEEMGIEISFDLQVQSRHFSGFSEDKGWGTNINKEKK